MVMRDKKFCAVKTLEEQGLPILQFRRCAILMSYSSTLFAHLGSRFE